MSMSTTAGPRGRLPTWVVRIRSELSFMGLANRVVVQRGRLYLAGGRRGWLGRSRDVIEPQAAIADVAQARQDERGDHANQHRDRRGLEQLGCRDVAGDEPAPDGGTENRAEPAHAERPPQSGRADARRIDQAGARVVAELRAENP